MDRQEKGTKKGTKRGHAQRLAFVLQFGKLCMLNRLLLGENLP